MNIKVSNRVYLDKAHLSTSVFQQIKKACTVSNPEFFKKRAMGYWVGNVPQHIRTYTDDEKQISVALGQLKAIVKILEENKVAYKIIDKRYKSENSLGLEFKSDFELSEHQTKLADIVLEKKNGYFVAPCGTGKTVMALYTVAKINQPTIFVVHNTLLMEQLVEAVHTFLGVDYKAIGTIGGSSKELNKTAKGKFKDITVAMIQSLKKKMGKIESGRFGCVVLDEAHHAPASTFLESIDRFDSLYRIGMTATPTRKDGKSFFIPHIFGEQLLKIDGDLAEEMGRIVPVNVYLAATDFNFDYENNDAIDLYLEKGEITSEQHKLITNNTINKKSFIESRNLKFNSYHVMTETISENKERNKIVIKLLLKLARLDKKILIMCKTRNEVLFLYGLLIKLGFDPCYALGGTKYKTQSSTALTEFKVGIKKILVATISYVGEGVDVPSVNVGVITSPVSSKNLTLLTQIIGRIRRTAPGKTESDFYYIYDRNVPILATVKKYFTTHYDNVETIDEGENK